jgi:nicotinate-nucleotide adenylyltransferase
MKRIGVLGGSFDPVHLGHLSLANDALVQGGLEQVVFMPVHRQPFKLDAKLASDEDRMAMIHEAIKDHPGLAVSDWEINCKGISYTYLTLRAMKVANPGAKICFITGTDTFLKVNIWKNAAELLRENCFLVGHRPGYREQELLAHVQSAQKAFGTEITVINNTRLDISSTQIRKMAAKNEPISNLVSPGVERYIKEHGLYL